MNLNTPYPRCRDRLIYKHTKLKMAGGVASATTGLVSKDFEHVNQESYFAVLEKGPSEKFQRGNSSPSSEQDSTTGGLDGFRARLQEEGISKTAFDLISRSRRPNSNASYELAWRKWAS